MSGLLVANRGEVALRIVRAARVLGLRVIVAHSPDDAGSLAVHQADGAVALPGHGPSAYLDVMTVVDAARRTGCDLLHPGYGFLSENPELAVRCAEARVRFVGPSPEVLALFGDKAASRKLAETIGVPVLEATDGAVDHDSALRFMTSLGEGASVIVKALAGGGGRGMRVVHDPRNLAAAMDRCRSEAERAFGTGDVLVERFLPRARHVEVQILGDGQDVVHLGERECSVQLRHQKLIEIAPAPHLENSTRQRIRTDAVELARATDYAGLGTMEFLVDVDTGEFHFIEANPRLQVEHGVTELVTGVDLVTAQIQVARGVSLRDQGITQSAVPEPRGVAVEARVSLAGDGGELSRFDVPHGEGLRVDTHGFVGLRTTASFDPLLAKVMCHRPDGDLAAACDDLAEALSEFAIEGAGTNIEFLEQLLLDPALQRGEVTTTWVEDRSGADVGAVDQVVAASAGTVVAVLAKAGQELAKGAPLVVLEAMKMEQEAVAPTSGRVIEICVELGDVVREGDELARLIPDDTARQHGDPAGPDVDLGELRSDLADTLRRHAVTLDDARPDAVARRHDRGRRTARENVADLLDADSFVEYGALVIAAQRMRREVEELERATPADGLVTGFGDVDGGQVALLAYDYTVLAGTQGIQNHKKAERMFELARRRGTPVVVFAEGGGGRPGDTDNLAKATGMDLGTFVALGRLNGVVPTVAIASGRCFAGNAALAGACDLIIATRDANIGMGGPAMIEGGGLGRHAPEEIGPTDVQAANGVVDVVVDDEEAGTAVARKYLGYFRGTRADWTCADQRRLRHVVPENRRRTFAVRELLDVLCDDDSVLELRPEFGRSVVTALGFIQGRPMGLVANDGTRLGGAIDSDAADKIARFLQLCDAHGLPVVTLCDTPGFLVGPGAEETASVRHFGRLFVTGPNLDVPLCTVLVRKAYGLGGQAMAGGSFRVPAGIVAWPTAELGAMGPEGAVSLGFRRELEQIADPDERQHRHDELLDEYVAHGRPANAASVFEVDDVIDPAQTRAWISATFATYDARRRPLAQRRRIDTW